MLQRHCGDAETQRTKAEHAFKTLRDILLLRPPLRDEAFRAVLEWCVSDRRASREVAVWKYQQIFSLSSSHLGHDPSSNKVFGCFFVNHF